MAGLCRALVDGRARQASVSVSSVGASSTRRAPFPFLSTTGAPPDSHTALRAKRRVLERPSASCDVRDAPWHMSSRSEAPIYNDGLATTGTAAAATGTATSSAAAAATASTRDAITFFTSL